jgi:hypothetical protein
VKRDRDKEARMFSLQLWPDTGSELLPQVPLLSVLRATAGDCNKMFSACALVINVRKCGATSPHLLCHPYLDDGTSFPLGLPGDTSPSVIAQKPQKQVKKMGEGCCRGVGVHGNVNRIL